MSRIHMKPLVIVGIVAATLALGVVAVGVIQRSRHATHGRATYYCPMHPGIVTDRPGDCPICNMKLVKRADQQSAVSSQQSEQSLQDICYLHNCPKVHDGKPCPMMVVAKDGEIVACPVCGTYVGGPSGLRQVLYWTDPMVPGYTSDKPGKSPMGMDLVPVYEEATPPSAGVVAPDGYAPILVTPEKRQFIGVKTAPVQRRAMTKTIRTVGLIAHDPELYQVEAEYIQALKAVERARQGGIPEVVEQAERLVESTRIRLRHVGLNEALIEEVGTWTQPDRRLLFGGAGQSWVYAQVYEYELPLIRVDQPVTIDVSTLSGRTFAGTVKAIAPTLEPMTRTARVRIIVDDPEGLLKPEMYVNVLVTIELGERLAVPEEAILATGTAHTIFVDKGQGLFEPRAVVIGVKADGYLEITAGVAEHELVVTSGNFLIDSESRLKAALHDVTSSTGSGQVGEGHQHGGH